MTQPLTPTQADRETAHEIHGTISRRLVSQCLRQGIKVTVGEFSGAPDHWLTQIIARHAQAARLEGARAMQEAAAGACFEQIEVFGSELYATGQPASSISERAACGICASAIEQIDPLSIAEKGV